MSNLHVIIGADDYLVSEAARKQIGDGTGLEVIDSVQATNLELQLAEIRKADESFSTPPFFDPVKVTWWKNVGFLPGGRASEEVTEALARFIGKLERMPLPENQKFILSGPKFLRTSRLYKQLAAIAQVVVFAEGKPWQERMNAEARAVEFAAEAGLRFAGRAAGAFIARVGTDTRSILSEIGKMRDYLGDGAKEITERDILEITSRGVGCEPEFWAVTDALGSRDLGKTLDAMRPFEGASGFAVMMTNMLERFFRQLYDLKRGVDAGIAEWQARKLAPVLGNWTLPELRLARARFLALREKAVSSSGSVDTLVVTTVVRTAGRRR